MNVMNNKGYIIFNLNWISLEFAIASDGGVVRRVKYGQNAWTDWVVV